VVIIHDSLNNQLAELLPSDCKVVSITSATAPWLLRLSGSDKISFNEHRFNNPGDRHWFTEKIRFILRLAASKGKAFLVLGAIDCTSGCPPPMVVRGVKNVLEEKEFGGWFRDIVFAVEGGLKARVRFAQMSNKYLCTFPNNYYTMGLPPRSHTSFINLGISSIHSLISSKVTRSHSYSITHRNSSTDRTERPRF
jgi:hypothetical protein